MITNDKTTLPAPHISFGSVCSGIEAASVAFSPLGWRAAWLAEIEPFPSAVLAHHYPTVPNLGDMTTIARRVLTGEVPAPDVFCGGTPCQSFSVAGLRGSLADARGNLTLKFIELADAIDHVRVRTEQPAATILWENVPGVLSTKDNAFGCFLAGLAGEDEPLQPAGEKWTNAGCVFGPQRAVAWRVLDAQYFGVAQRRRRVFVVASARKGFDPAAVLFEYEGVRRDIAPRREAGEVAPTIPARSTAGGGLGTDCGLIEREWPAVLASTLDTSFGPKQGLDDQHVNAGCPWFVPAIAAFKGGQGSAAGGIGYSEHVSPTLSSADSGSNRVPVVMAPAIAFPTAVSYGIPGNWIGRAPENGGNAVAPMRDVSPCLTSTDRHGVATPCVSQAVTQVRRLTPTECERLQGFPDNYTAIPWRKKPADQCPDGPRYKALGNSWAVPVVAWIGRRINRAMQELT